MALGSHLPNMPRPSLAEMKQALADAGWSPSEASYESPSMVFAFSRESYRGTLGGAAAVASWNDTGWLSLPPQKPRGVQFV